MFKCIDFNKCYAKTLFCILILTILIHGGKKDQATGGILIRGFWNACPYHTEECLQLFYPLDCAIISMVVNNLPTVTSHISWDQEYIERDFADHVT